ncbi:MAG: lytic transglycosylase domain-containing protein [Clostridiaceae bacterium]|nr:lytic transglycosylase domain-containing protein [Clostridiaceae bacterium]
MKVDATQDLLQIQLMTQMMKSAAGGNNNTFNMVMSTLLNSLQSNGTDLSELNILNDDSSNLTTGNYEAINNLKQNINFNVKSGNSSIDEAVDKASKEYKVDKKLIMSVINQESSFNPNAVSRSGAQGLMQLMPGTARELGVKNSFDIKQNVEGGTKYLKGLLDRYGNSKEMALAAYNAGAGTVKNRGMHNANEVYKMPSETQDYVKKIIANYNKQV